MQLDGLMEHQKAGVKWLLDNPKGMLAWEMGVGKTATATRAWELTAEQGPALVLCLASARENWRREIQRFALDPAFPPSVQVLFSQGTPIDPNVSVVVTNYDKLQQPMLMHSLRSRRWGVVITDEAHVLKTPSARRTKLVYGGLPVRRPLLDYTDRMWPLTGTPMPNNPAELWTHAHALWPQAIQYNGAPMDLQTFELGFCVMRQGEYGRTIIGGRNLAELRERLSPHMNRLKRKDVLTLPPLRIDSWPLDMETTSGVGKYPDCPDLREKLAHYGPIDQFDQGTLDAYLTCINAAYNPLATLRRETGLLKAIAATFLLRDELEATTSQKTVVFAHHRDAIEALAKGLTAYQPAVLHGGTPDKARQGEIDRFNQDPRCRVFIGQLQAAGSSINLQAADNVVFAEASWSPGENDQALSRVYRAGQTKPVLVRFAYLKGSVDEAVNRALARKAAMIAQVLQ